MLGWRRLSTVAALDAALFALAGLTAHSSRHSGTLSNVLWVDFLLGVVLLLVLLAAALLRLVARR